MHFQMNYPRISIVTPSYNQAPYIAMTVRSVLLQRYPNLEYIMMDGASTDGTLSELAQFEDRFAYYVSAKDKGQSDAIARGFERTTGEIMGYLNSDDLLAPGALHFVAQFFDQNPNVDFVYSHRCTIGSDNKAIWYWMLPQHKNYLMMRWDLIPQETCFWRRSLFSKCGNIDPSYRFAMDYDLFVRYMLRGKFVRVNRFLGAFRQHQQAKTSQLLQTVGDAEMKRVWSTYGLTSGRLDPFRRDRFWFGVQRDGQQFAASRKQLPGCMPGVGYDYDAVWAWQLRDGRLPPVASPTHS